MKKGINSREWEQLLLEHPELARDLEAFFREEEGSVTSVVGFYSVLKMRLRQFLSFQKDQAGGGDARADEIPPPHSAGQNG
jgi:hypothetical protein